MEADKKKGVKVLAEIGSGGFGKVYTCIYKGKECVVKKISTNQATYNLKTVQSELLILKHVKHPRIVQMISFYETGTHWNFILEYMKLGSMRDMLNKFKSNKWKFGQSDLLSLFMDVAVGVRYLHNIGIIHRDLKPDNILVDEKHRLKIADFGISKVYTGAGADFQTAVGTLTYMAPEVFLSQPYDRTVDIWALGIILYEMAMTKYPFNQADKARIMNSRLSFTPPEIDYKRRNYDPAIQELMSLMLQRNPQKRVDLNCVCKMPIVRKIYEELKAEEAKAGIPSKK